MNTTTFAQELELFRLKISYYFGQFLAFVRQVIADPTIVPKTDLILMGAVALILALFLLGGLIRFFTEPWKRKGRSLLTTLLALVILAVVAFFVMRSLPLPNA